jgi:hypothetical protein
MVIFHSYVKLPEDIHFGAPGVPFFAHLPKPREARGPDGSLGSNEPTNGGVPQKLDGWKIMANPMENHGTSLKQIFW